MKASERPALIAFSGNTRRPSKSRTLAEAIVKSVARELAVEADIFDMIDVGPDLGAFERDRLPSRARLIIEKIERCDGLIVVSPVYKGSYTGLFKHLFDFIDPTFLHGRPTIIGATGGGLRHALVVEHQLRPLFGFFSALTMPTSIYASETEFEGKNIQQPILDRIDMAAKQFACSIKELSGRPSRGSSESIASSQRHVSN